MSEIPSWFNATLDWGKVGALIATLVACVYFGINTWQDNKQQLVETRAAIRELTLRVDDSLSKRDERLSVADREIKALIAGAVERGSRERQILENRVIALESRQDADDRRSREDAIVIATLREQVTTVLVAVNALRDLMMNATIGPRSGPRIK